MAEDKKPTAKEIAEKALAFLACIGPGCEMDEDGNCRNCQLSAEIGAVRVLDELRRHGYLKT